MRSHILLDGIFSLSERSHERQSSEVQPKLLYLRAERNLARNVVLSGSVSGYLEGWGGDWGELPKVGNCGLPVPIMRFSRLSPNQKLIKAVAATANTGHSIKILFTGILLIVEAAI